jgi:uncharacterized protein YyaL (SSP411 family)
MPPVAHGVPADPSPSDNDHPSGISAVAQAAMALWRLGAGDRYRRAVDALVARYAARALAEPLAHGALLRVASETTVAPHQLVIVGARDDPLVRAASAIAADVVAIVTAEQCAALADAGFELFAGKGATVATVYDCQGFACRLPVTTLSALRAATASAP